jgi:hypothetical protein
MDTTLFRRIVAGIPRTTDTWSERARQDHDLEHFLPESDREIAIIAAFLHGHEDATSSALSDNDEKEGRVAFELGSGTRHHGDVGGSGDRAVIRT